MDVVDKVCSKNTHGSICGIAVSNDLDEKYISAVQVNGIVQSPDPFGHRLIAHSVTAIKLAGKIVSARETFLDHIDRFFRRLVGNGLDHHRSDRVDPASVNIDRSGGRELVILVQRFKPVQIGWLCGVQRGGRNPELIAANQNLEPTVVRRGFDNVHKRSGRDIAFD